MATPHKVVVTAKTGPDRAVTALNILDVEAVTFDLVGKTMSVQVDQSNVALPPTADGKSDDVKDFDISLPTATVVVAVAAGVFTVTVVS